MKETFLLLFLMTAMTAITLRPMLAERSVEAVAGQATAPEAFAGDHGSWLLAERLATQFPGHARLRAEAAAGDRAKW